MFSCVMHRPAIYTAPSTLFPAGLFRQGGRAKHSVKLCLLKNATCREPQKIFYVTVKLSGDPEIFAAAAARPNGAFLANSGSSLANIA